MLIVGRARVKKSKRSADVKSSATNLPSQIQDFTLSSTNIKQCNIQRIANKKAEITDLRSEEKPDVL